LQLEPALAALDRNNAHQRRERAASMGALPAQFHRRFRWWFALGIPAFAAVVVIFYLMVAKPLAVTGT
jgi:uncharacterized membrane protein